MSDAPSITPTSMIERQIPADAIGAAGFLYWLRASMPAAYKAILPDLKRMNQVAVAGVSNSARGGLGTLGETQAGSGDVPAGNGPASSTWADSVLKLLAGWGQYKLADQQLDMAKQIATTNLSRAQQGLAPLAYDAAQLGIAPTLNFGLSNTTAKLVLWGGGGLLAFLFINSALKHRR